MADAFQPRFVDLVRNYTMTTGTGNFVLESAVQGYRSFDSQLQAGDSFYYSAVGIDEPTEFEVGRGRMEADGTISRDPTGGNFTSFTSGTKAVSLVAAAEWYEKVGSVAAATPVAVATCDELASLTDFGRPALLTEDGRGGLFGFDPSDLSARVSGDTQQGIYVAPASDPSGASGAWIRAYSGAVEARWFGAAGDGLADDTGAIQAALTHFETAGAGVLRLGSGTFSITGTLLNFASDLTIDAQGATVVASDGTSNPMLFIGGNGVRVLAGTWKVPHLGSRQIDVEGQNCHLDKCAIRHEPDADTVQMYVRYGANGFRMTNCRFSGANEAIFVEASGVFIMGNEFLGAETIGGDDCIGIKAIRGITENIRIVGNYMRRHAAMVSFGSSIGTVGADDPAYSHRVRNVTIVGNTGERCSYGLYIKPGAVAADYRNGVVEGVTFSDNVLYDSKGEVFERGIAITAGRGAIVRDIRGDNNIVVARSSGTGSTGAKLAFHIFGGFDEPATFENIDVELCYRDPYGGVASGGEAPGYPIANIVCIQPNGSILRDINIRVDGSGCAGAGIYIYPGADDQVAIGRANLDKINVAATADGGITTSSKIRVSDDISIKMAVGNAYRLINGTSAGLVSTSDMVFFAETIPAGADQIRRPWVAPRNAFVHRIEMLSASAINQSADDTNYTQFDFRNIGGNSNIFHSVSSKATGGRSFPADTFSALLDASEITNTTDQGQCFFARGSHLYAYKNDFGSGNVVSKAYMRIHWAPY
jgi:hypothetical protein